MKLYHTNPQIGEIKRVRRGGIRKLPFLPESVEIPLRRIDQYVAKGLDELAMQRGITSGNARCGLVLLMVLRSGIRVYFLFRQVQNIHDVPLIELHKVPYGTSVRLLAFLSHLAEPVIRDSEFA